MDNKCKEMVFFLIGSNCMTNKILEEIVRTNDKQRYALNHSKTKIRANQGHSVPVDVELTERVPGQFLSQ